jgi:alanyl-tRNA synthetase
MESGFYAVQPQKRWKFRKLTDMHVDTGMGFERLVRVIHGKSSNYDTDIFLDTIQELEIISNKNMVKRNKLILHFE